MTTDRAANASRNEAPSLRRARAATPAHGVATARPRGSARDEHRRDARRARTRARGASRGV